MSIAVITQVFNEDFFLPIWLNHYGRMVGYENLYVIDDGSDDGSTDDPRIQNLVRKKRAPLSETERSSFVSRFHSDLLSRYEFVVYADADELIVLDPNAGVDFATYMRSIKANSIKLIGFDVLHDVDHEPDIDIGKSLFAQRSFLKFEVGYCKPLISRVPIQWDPGFHDSNLRSSISKLLFLFHLRSIDYKHSARRIRSLNAVEFSSEAIRRNHSYHFRWSEEMYLKKLYEEPNRGIPLARKMELVDALLLHKSNPNAAIPVIRVPERFMDTIKLSAFSE